MSIMRDRDTARGSRTRPLPFFWGGSYGPSSLVQLSTGEGGELEQEECQDRPLDVPPEHSELPPLRAYIYDSPYAREAETAEEEAQWWEAYEALRQHEEDWRPFEVEERSP